MVTPLIAVEPKSGRFESIEVAVAEGGGELVPVEQAEALIWADAHNPDDLPAMLDRGPNLRWVSLPFAGIEPFVPYLTEDLTWTCARGVYSKPVAEHALMLGLAGLRGLTTYVPATTWSAPEGHNLFGGKVTIFGAGGITQELIKLLAPFDCEITVIRRRADPLAGANRTLALDDRLHGLADADLVVLALALTDTTHGVIGEAELAAMADHGWLVNVARGGHVQVDPLLRALRAGTIGGAALDVTAPEPLPDGHELWAESRVIITPHIGNTPEMGVPLLADHVRSNVANLRTGRELEGLVSVTAGY